MTVDDSVGEDRARIDAGPLGAADEIQPCPVSHVSGGYPVWELAYTVEPIEDGLDQLTVYPQECSPDELMTHWITADEGSFVDVRDVR